ncbi:nucleotidyltransferase domain-containing protein [Streptomyces sp. BA2]|uniref:nucleotidyltransferase domain-containing protein n=1 Tax=Streptomyces sp. BA2 TaxID=436595 RepID=UPI003014F860
MVTELYPHDLGAILGGSAAQGRATATSDLDVAVLLPDSDISRREVIRHQGRIVELFLNTLGDIPEFFAWDRARRRGTVLFVYDQGLPLADPVLGKALLDGHQAVAEHAVPRLLTTAVNQVLDLLGGPLLEGFSHPWRA